MSSTTFRFGIAAAAVVLIALAGLRLLPGSGVGGAEGSPTPSPTPSQSASMSPEASGPIILEPGTHTTTAFALKTSFTVPAGWMKTSDTASGFRLEPATSGVDAQLDVCRGDATAVDNQNQPIPGIGDSPAEILAAVANRTDLEVIQEPTPWEETNLPGYWMEVRNPSDTELVVIGPTCGNNLYPTGHNRFAILEGPDGTKIVVTIFTFEGSEALIEAMTPIAESLEFETP